MYRKYFTISRYKHNDKSFDFILISFFLHDIPGIILKYNKSPNTKTENKTIEIFLNYKLNSEAKFTERKLKCKT